MRSSLFFNAFVVGVLLLLSGRTNAQCIDCPYLISDCGITGNSSNVCTAFDPDFNIQSGFAFDQFMGINFTREDPINRLRCVGFLREYHEWEAVEDHSKNYPCNFYTWNPTPLSIGLDSYDNMYSQIEQLGLPVCATMTRNIPQIRNINGYGGLESMPSVATTNSSGCTISSGANLTGLPQSYQWHADFIYQYLNRYSQVGVVNSGIAKANEKQTSFAVSYLENWNEPDAYWWGYSGSCFGPEAYAAMTCADIYGTGFNGNSPFQLMGSVSGGNEYSLGVQPFGVRLVFGGLANTNLGYLCSVRNWFEERSLEFPFDVLNFHVYHNETGDLCQGHTNAVPPEEAVLVDGETLELRERLRRVAQTVENDWDGRELWLSEFGYDSDPGSIQGVQIIGDNDGQEVQGQWLVRSYLAIAAAGFDRAILYRIRDAPGNPTGEYQTAGILGSVETGFQPKKAWYYIYSLKNILSGYRYTPNHPEEECGSQNFEEHRPRIYVFENGVPGEETYGIWSPTHSDDGTYTHQFPVPNPDAQVTLIELQVPSTDGIRTELAVQGTVGNFFVEVPVSERPVFVKFGGAPPSSPLCVSGLTATDPTCMGITLNWDEWSPNDGGVCEDRHFQIMYGLETVVDDVANGSTLDNPNTSLLTSYVDDLSGCQTSAIVAGLSEQAPYVFYVVGFDADGRIASDNGHIWCARVVAKPNGDGFCHLEYGTQFNVIQTNAYPGIGNIDPLFDEQGIDMCGFGSEYGDCTVYNDVPLTDVPRACSEWLSNNTTETVIELDGPYNIDAIYFYDGSDAGYFSVFYKDSPTDDWKETSIQDYHSLAYRRWKFYTGVTPPNEPVRYLKFVGSYLAGAEPRRAKIGEVFICGHPVTCTDDPVGPPAVIQDFDATSTAPTSITLTWGNLPNDPDLVQGQIVVTYTPAGGTQGFVYGIPVTATTYTLNGLQCGAKYTVTVKVVDCEGNESEAAIKDLLTLPCPNCEIDGLVQKPGDETCTTVRLSWYVSGCECEDISEHDFQLFQVPGCQGGGCPALPVNAQSATLTNFTVEGGGFQCLASADITGLDPAVHDYCFYVNYPISGTWLSVCGHTLPPSACDGCACGPVPMTGATAVYETTPPAFASNSLNPPDPCIDEGLDKSPQRMVDEQSHPSLQEFCTIAQEGCGPSHNYDDCVGRPVTEWFPGWGNYGSGISAVITLAQPEDINGVYIFDTFGGENNETISVDYCPTGAGCTPTTGWVNIVDHHVTGAFMRWCNIYYDATPIPAAKLRVTKHGAGSHFSEIAICSEGAHRIAERSKAGDKGRVEPENISLFPNPATNRLTLQFPPALYNSLTIMDLHGKAMLTTPLLEGEKERQIELAALPSGIYLVRFEGVNGGSVYKRFLKI